MTWQRAIGRSVPCGLQQRCFKRDRFTCQRCGYIGAPGAGDLNADHVRNLADGGQSVLENLMTLCVACHKVKTLPEQRRGRRLPRRRPAPQHPADTVRLPCR